MILSRQEASIIRLLTLCTCVATASTFATDQVTRISDGATIRGEFKILSKTQVVIKRSNDEVESVSPDDIRDIRFDREPPRLRIARSNERSGSYATAIKQLQEVKSDYTGGDRRVLVEIEFLLSRCQARLALIDPGITQTALASLQSFLQKNGSSYRTLEGMLMQARLLIETDRTRATELLEQLRSSGVDGFVMQAGVVLGHTLLDEKKMDQARQIFDEVIQKSLGKPTALTAHYDSRIGRAKCLQQQNELPEALKALEAVIAEVPDEQSATLARAWVHMGDCHRDDNNPRAALLAYLHVDILYPEATAEHAEALYQLTPLWETAGHPDRARDAQSRLEAQYPDSRWAQPNKE